MIRPDKYIKNMAGGGLTIEMQEKLAAASVIVMGVGGLGSGVVMNLAAMGVGKIKLIDSDVVEEENFNRQIIHKYRNLKRAKVISAKDWIQEFNPDIKVELDKVRLDEFNYLNTVSNYDIIVDCFDNVEAKYLLNDIALRHEKILIYGEVKGFQGQVTTIIPKKTGCLACVKPKPILQRKDTQHAQLSPIVNTIAAIQATEVLKVITGISEPLINRLLSYDALKLEFKNTYYSRNLSCSTCRKFN